MSVFFEFEPSNAASIRTTKLLHPPNQKINGTDVLSGNCNMESSSFNWTSFSLKSYLKDFCIKTIESEPEVRLNQKQLKGSVDCVEKMFEFNCGKFRKEFVKNTKLNALSDLQICQNLIFLSVLLKKLEALPENRKDFLIRFINYKKILFQFYKNRFKFLIRLLRGKKPKECLIGFISSDLDLDSFLPQIFAQFCKPLVNP